MAESEDDKKVDGAVERMQALLDELKGAQAKDVADESGDDWESPRDEQPKSLRDATIKVRAHLRRARQAAREQ